jgi:uncharacterized RDD family membrane protein YckC
VLLTLVGVVFIVVGVLLDLAWFKTATKIEGVWIIGVIGVVCFSSGVGCYRLGKKLRAESAEEILARDPRPPVLYLRSFRDDEKTAATIKGFRMPFSPEVPIEGLATEEEQLAMVADRVGPFLAIGQPGERLPKLGGRRVYISDDRWQETVRELVRASGLVILRVGQTEGFWWEVMTCAREADPQRLLFLLPKKEKLYEPFRQRASEYLPCRLPDFPQSSTWSGGPSGSIGGVLWFERDWTPRIARVCGRVLGLLGHRVAVELAEALAQVLRRAGATEFVIAPTARRCAAALLDALFLGLLIAAAYLLAGLLLPEDPELRIPLLLMGLGLGFPTAYFIGFEVSPWRATPGKRLLQLEVWDRSGVPISWYQAVFRLFWKFFTVVSGLWLVSLVLSLTGRRTIHDWLSRSTVVKRRAQVRAAASPVPRSVLLELMATARNDPKRDKPLALFRLAKRYCLLRGLMSIPALAATIGSGYVMYRETGHVWYTAGAVLAMLFLGGLIMDVVEKAGATHVKKRIASTGLNPDERASLAGRLQAAKKDKPKDDLIDPLLAILK